MWITAMWISCMRLRCTWICQTHTRSSPAIIDKFTLPARALFPVTGFPDMYQGGIEDRPTQGAVSVRLGCHRGRFGVTGV
jgi:hypothetical protein